MAQLLQSILDQVRPTTLIDIGITALLIYWLFSLIRGTRAVRLVIGVIVLFLVYFAAQALSLRLLTQILQTGAVVLSAAGHGALIVLERDTGLEEIAETGVMIHGDVSAELLMTIFAPRTALHDGAVVIRGASILAAGALLPLAETTIHTERFGTRHRAALGITEQTDAVVVVISEENHQISIVERARIVRNLSQAQLERSIRALLVPTDRRARLSRRPGAQVGRPPGGRAPRLAD